MANTKLFKNGNSQAVRARFAECFVGDMVISAITLAELEYGVACSGNARAHNQALLDSPLEDTPVEPFEAQAARACGPLRLGYRACNKDAMDKLIAAHPLSLGLTQVDLRFKCAQRKF